MSESTIPGKRAAKRTRAAVEVAALPTAEELARQLRDRDWPYVPGWPARGKFSEDDKLRISVCWPSFSARTHDFVAGLHMVQDSTVPRDEKRLRRYAYDALWLVHNNLSCIVVTRSAPIFRVACAVLLEAGFDLPPKATTCRRELAKIIARVRREQRAVPEADPSEAGVTCKSFPTIAIGVARRDRAELPTQIDASRRH